MEDSVLREHRLPRTLKGSSALAEAFYGAGHNSPGYVYSSAPTSLGMPSNAIRTGIASDVIAHTLCPCALGTLLVATSNKGICAVYIGDNGGDLRAALKAQFPRARLEEAAPKLTEIIEAVASLIESPDRTVKLPLDIRGTAFQRQVWEALQHIPAGSTISYAQLAAKIGAPKAARAVAGACAANQIAVAIPCHRVVRGDGSISGYRWGVERKQALLDAEARRKP